MEWKEEQETTRIQDSHIVEKQTTRQRGGNMLNRQVARGQTTVQESAPFFTPVIVV